MVICKGKEDNHMQYAGIGSGNGKGTHQAIFWPLMIGILARVGREKTNPSQREWWWESFARVRKSDCGCVVSLATK